jgi:hypothetical protein
VIIHLSYKHIEEAWEVADLRLRPKLEAFGSENDEKKYKWIQGHAGRMKAHIFGILCEMAVGKIFNVDIDRNFYWQGDLNQGDIILPNGETIEVKGRFFKQGVFLLNSKNIKEFKADYGVLCFPAEKLDQPIINIHGYVKRDYFLKNAKIYDFSHGKKWGLEPTHFRDIKILQEVVDFSLMVGV